ncbi:hypothetical protein AVEN_37503-1, partial [Araneus ventricosus]
SSLFKPSLPAPRGVAEMRMNGQRSLNDLSGCRTNHPTTNMCSPSSLIIGKGHNVMTYLSASTWAVSNGRSRHGPFAYLWVM